jgi:hypothetical protein
MSEQLTNEEIEVLNAARTILEAHSKFTGSVAAYEAKAATRAEVAEEAIFKYLNVTSAFLGVAMTYEQLHNRADKREQVPA